MADDFFLSFPPSIATLAFAYCGSASSSEKRIQALLVLSSLVETIIAVHTRAGAGFRRAASAGFDQGWAMLKKRDKIYRELGFKFLVPMLERLKQHVPSSTHSILGTIRPPKFASYPRYRSAIDTTESDVNKSSAFTHRSDICGPEVLRSYATKPWFLLHGCDFLSFSVVVPICGCWVSKSELQTSASLCWTFITTSKYKSENAQPEELVFAELSKSYEARIKQLQQDLSVSKNEVARVESNMAEALAIKNFEIEALVSAIDGLKKQLLYPRKSASLRVHFITFSLICHITFI
ncbi:hypothetical protein FNV43_RR14586 [Rhamnella rubrinervis]|uniref:Uncharacterized protein n=1 Tax=Rhamnella rubrinervis TaxID=2594499 RepID=A0A8K0MGK2_9ROSA|nr:hypothetical protein FNV43_RR14586 [Rhamnella rubrinervis]